MNKPQTKRSKTEPNSGAETKKPATEEPTVEALVEAVAEDVQASKTAGEELATQDSTVEEATANRNQTGQSNY